jgi:hypothetical protein
MTFYILIFFENCYIPPPPRPPTTTIHQANYFIAFNYRYPMLPKGKLQII